MDEEDLRSHIKKGCLQLREVDEGILDAYNSLSQDFRDSLPFKDYYRFYREDVESQARQRRLEEDLMSEPEPVSMEDVAPEDLCKNCGENRKAFDDRDYCSACREELREKGEDRAREIIGELMEDKEFLSLTSERKARIYVKQKYAADKKANKFVFLDTIGKDAYAQKRISENE